MMEYMHVVCFPNRWRMRWGMKEAMLALKAHPLKCYTDVEGFHDAFYLATHIGYMVRSTSCLPCSRRTPAPRIVMLHHYFVCLRPMPAAYRQISAYSAVQAPIQRLVPWLDSYVRHSFKYIMKTWERNDKKGLGCCDPVSRPCSRLYPQSSTVVALTWMHVETRGPSM
jgi:hypothetical protein